MVAIASIAEDIAAIEGRRRSYVRGRKKFFGNRRFRKSTLLNIIGGIDHADSGYISINGDKLEELGEKRLTQYRRKHLGSAL